MTRVSTVLRSKRPPSTRRGPRNWLSPTLRWLTDSRAGVGASLFILKMAVRDWQFRRATLRGAVPMLMLVLFATQRGLRSPFDGDPGFTLAHVLPHIAGAAFMTAADFLPFSDHYKARWIFLTVPASGLRGVVRGTLATLWLMGAVAPSLLLFAATSVVWGVADAGLFAGYSLGVLSFYVGAFAWIQSGLPFTRPPDPSRAAGNMSIMFGCLIVMFILGAIQAIWVFPHPVRVVVAAIVLGAAAWFAGRFSIRILENRTRDALQSFVQGPGRMFAMTRDDADR